MTATLQKKPIGTKRIIATNVVIESPKRMKYDDNKIAERVPIDELRSGMYQLPEWAEGLFDVTPEGQPRRRRRLTHLSNEEKILRRKLKNRVAAQNARDKKRDESERIKIENENLHQTVTQLKADAEVREVIIFLLHLIKSRTLNRFSLELETYSYFSRNWTDYAVKMLLCATDWASHPLLKK